LLDQFQNFLVSFSIKTLGENLVAGFLAPFVAGLAPVVACVVFFGIICDL